MIEDGRAAAETTLDRVIEGLRLGDRFEFHMIVCTDPRQVEWARGRLSDALGEAMIDAEIMLQDLSHPHGLLERLERMPHGVLVLRATVMESQADRWALVFQRLNESRNYLISRFDGLVLLLPSRLKSISARYASDLFAVRSISVTLEPMDERESEASAQAPMPADIDLGSVYEEEEVASPRGEALASAGAEEQRGEYEPELAPEPEAERMLELGPTLEPMGEPEPTPAPAQAPEFASVPGLPSKPASKPKPIFPDVGDAFGDAFESAQSSSLIVLPTLDEPDAIEEVALIDDVLRERENDVRLDRSGEPAELDDDDDEAPQEPHMRERSRKRASPAASPARELVGSAKAGPPAAARPAPDVARTKSASTASPSAGPGPAPAKSSSTGSFAVPPSMAQMSAAPRPSSPVPAAGASPAPPDSSTPAPPAPQAPKRRLGIIDRVRRWARRGERGLDPSKPPLRILLLSSLLVRGKTKDRSSVDERMRSLMLDIEELRATAGLSPFDVVVVAGDVAAWGGAAEMEYAWMLLRHFTARVGPSESPPPLLLVPGNHDISKGLAKWRNPARRGVELDDTMNLRNNMAIAKESGRRFRGLVQQLYDDGVVPSPPTSEPYLMLNHEMEHCGRRVAVRGFDSAWGLPWARPGMGLLGTQQIEAALAGLDDADLRIAVVHHPPDMMDPDEWAMLRTSFDVVLTGPSTSLMPVQRTPDRAVLISGPGLSGKTSTGEGAGYAILELGASARVQLRWLGTAREPMLAEYPLGLS